MLCEVPGASAVFRGGWVTYSDRFRPTRSASRRALATHGAVSAPVARAMALGASRAATPTRGRDDGRRGAGPDDRGVAQGTVFVALAAAATRTPTSASCTSRCRARSCRRAAVVALDLVRRRLRT
jgi:nicotinamide mononucleotide (NMN) deamidase PncC